MTSSNSGWEPFGRRPQSGFTLIELMVTVAVMGILVVIAVPAFTSSIRNNTQRTLANSLVYALNYARSEAIKRDAPISLCPSPDGQTCTTGVSAWTGLGWMAYSGNPSSPTPLQAWPKLPAGVTLVTKNGSSAYTGTIQYQPSGLAYANNGTATTVGTITFNLCDVRGASSAVAIELAPTGRAEISQYPGYPVAGPSSSSPLTCP